MMKRAGLLIGNRGISLLEVLITVTILSIGLTFLFPSFFRSGSAMSYLNTRYEANLAVNNLLSDIEEHLKKQSRLPKPWPVEGHVSSGTKLFKYEAEVEPITIYRRMKKFEMKTVHKITATVKWQNPRSGAITRTTYVAH